MPLDCRTEGIGTHRSCDALLQVWILLYRKAALTAGISPMPAVSHLFMNG